MDKTSSKLTDTGTIWDKKMALAFSLLLLIGLALPNQGFCDTADPHGMNTMADSIVNTIFSPWLRKTFLGFGAVGGLIHSFAAKSWMPLFTWGGIGLTMNYIPRIINMLAG